MPKTPSYSLEFRLEAVRLMRSSDRSVPKFARELGMAVDVAERGDPARREDRAALSAVGHRLQRSARLGALRLLRTQLLAATIGFSALGGLAVAAIVHFALGALPGPYLGLSAGCAWIRREALDIVNQRIAKGATMSSTSENIVQLTASGDADQVEARLREALDGHGLQLFARIDHAAGARKADVELEATSC